MVCISDANKSFFLNHKIAFTLMYHYKDMGWWSRVCEDN